MKHGATSCGTERFDQHREKEKDKAVYYDEPLPDAEDRVDSEDSGTQPDPDAG